MRLLASLAIASMVLSLQACSGISVNPSPGSSPSPEPSVTTLPQIICFGHQVEHDGKCVDLVEPAPVTTGDSSSITVNPCVAGYVFEPGAGACVPVGQTHPVSERRQIFRNRLFRIVDQSACVKYKWKERSVGPLGYFRGMANQYARSSCRPDLKIMGQALGTADKDALKAYEKRLLAQGAKLDSPAGLLEANYLLLIGLGMRESSGRHCAGRDTTAKKPSSTTAEAGLFQVSFNSMGTKAGGETDLLLAQYTANPHACALDIFAQGVNPKGGDCAYAPYGSGQGKEWQELSRSCPAYATEHAATLVRLNKPHWGPLVRGEPEIMSECREMLDSVRDLVEELGCGAVS